MRILVFGDSIARGSFDAECGGWVDRLSAAYNQKSVDENKYLNTFNLGISGEASGDLKDRIVQETIPRLVDNTGEVVILIQCGINDSKYLLEAEDNLTYLGDFKSNYKAIVTHAQEYADHVFCLGLTRVDELKVSPIPPNNRIAFRNKDIVDYETVVKGVANELKATYIELADAVPIELLTDGIHPNAEGHKRIFEKVKSVLEAKNLL